MFLAEFRHDNWAASDLARLQDLFLCALEASADWSRSRRTRPCCRSAAAPHPGGFATRAQLRTPHATAVARRTTSGRDARYNDLSEALARGLNVKPHARTTRLYDAIRRGQPTRRGNRECSDRMAEACCSVAHLCSGRRWILGRTTRYCKRRALLPSGRDVMRRSSIEWRTRARPNWERYSTH